MFERKITISGKERTILFGGYVQQLLYEDGIKLADLGQIIQDNPFGIVPKIIWFGLINGSKDWQGDGITLRDVYNWVDEQGGVSSEQIQSFVELCVKSISQGVPEVNEAKKKQAPKK